MKDVLQTQRIDHYSYFCRNEKIKSGALAVTARLDSYNPKCLGENCHFSYSTGCEDKHRSYFLEPTIWDRGCCSSRVLVAHSCFLGLRVHRLLAEESAGLWQEAPETRMLPLDNEAALEPGSPDRGRWGGKERLCPCPVSAACGEAYGVVMWQAVNSRSEKNMR